MRILLSVGLAWARGAPRTRRWRLDKAVAAPGSSRLDAEGNRACRPMRHGQPGSAFSSRPSIWPAAVQWEGDANDCRFPAEAGPGYGWPALPEGAAQRH